MAKVYTMEELERARKKAQIREWFQDKKVKAQTLVDNVLTGVGKHQTSVVLLHDAANKNTTVEALPAIIEEIQAMDDTVLLPVSDDMEFVQHLKLQQSTAQQ